MKESKKYKIEKYLIVDNWIVYNTKENPYFSISEIEKKQGIKTILYTYYEKKRDTNFSRSNHLIKSVHKYKLISKEDLISSAIIESKLDKEKK